MDGWWNCGEVDSVSLTVGSFLPGEAFGGFFCFKKFPLTLSAPAVRIVDAPADFSVVDSFLYLHVRCLLVP
jgi:hypothetical protein